MKLIIAIVALALPAAAFADPAMGDRAAQFQAQLENRFAAADTNGDGKLTRGEAKAGMPGVYRHFDAIDAGHSGYVTKDEIMATIKKRLAARKNGQMTQ